MWWRRFRGDYSWRGRVAHATKHTNGIAQSMSRRRRRRVLWRDCAFSHRLVCRLEFPHFPAGTLVVNLIGSFLLGWFMGFVSVRSGFPETIRLAVTVGFIGTYTTFSTFMYESDALIRDPQYLKA